MATIPDDVLHIIATFLPYNDRIEVNKLLPVKYRVTNKLESDSHNLQVKMKLLQDKIQKCMNLPEASSERINSMKDVFLYLLDTKDECLFKTVSSRFIDVTKEKAQFFANVTNYNTNALIKYPTDVDALMLVCARLVSYIDETPTPPNNTKPQLVRIA